LSNSRRNHTREFKLQCCRQIVTGQKRPAQICCEHNLSESVLLRWRKEYETRGETAFTEKQPSGDEALEARIAELERFCGQLSLENQILKSRSRACSRQQACRDRASA
jgi:transposase-like protein